MIYRGSISLRSTKSSIPIVPRRFQRDVLELPLCHLDECVGVDLVALDDVLVVDLLAGISVTLAYLMRWPVFRLSWLNETFSDSDVAR
jgi:hypothetical protein